MLNTAVLNAHIDDVGCIRRERQVAPRLDKQKHKNHENRFPVREHVFENLTHFFPFLSFFVYQLAGTLILSFSGVNFFFCDLIDTIQISNQLIYILFL